MKPHPLLTAKMPLVLTKELQLAMVRWFIERERLWARRRMPTSSPPSSPRSQPANPPISSTR